MANSNSAATEIPRSSIALTRFAWFCVFYNLLVIAWGAYVRATASGAGCGNDWPVCKGGITPDSGDTHQLIEYTHRASSGLALVLAVVLFIWVWRTTARGLWIRITSAA